METRQLLTVSTVVGMVVLVVALAHAADPAARCEARKVKAMGKYVACQTTTEAKAALKGLAVDPADLAKCAGRFLKAWGDAETQSDGLCSDPPGIDASIAEATSTLYAAWATAYVQGEESDICAGPCDQCVADLTTCTADLATCEASSWRSFSSIRPDDYVPPWRRRRPAGWWEPNVHGQRGRDD